MTPDDEKRTDAGDGDTRGSSADARARDSATREGSEEPPDSPNEEELRAQLEEEIKKVRVEDVVLQSVVSILNLAARRIAKDDERDLEQAKVGIDAGRALVDLVSPEAQPQLRQALAELQVLYAKYAGEESPEAEVDGEKAGEKPKGGKPKGGKPKGGKPKGKKGDSRLWTPGSSD